MTIQVLPGAVFYLMVSLKEIDGDWMSTAVHKAAEKLKSSRWWPTGVATSLTEAAVVALRGCWHRRMSWPIEVQGYKYQVCLGCGIKRLFNETTFSAYGPFRYDLDELIASTGVSQPASIAEMPRATR